MNKEENILYGGMLSDIDIRSFWGKGIAIFSSEPGGIAFDLKEQLQFGSIDLHARHACNTIKLSKNEVYIASKYIEHKEQNHAIYHALKQASIDAFLPESINITALTEEEMYTVSEICFKEIERCDVILAVCPFGQSVSGELGYAIALKRKCGQRKTIIALNMDFPFEAMLAPYVDKTVEDIPQLIEYLNSIKK